MKNTPYNRGAVYYVDLGEADGTSVQAGVRPCILVSSNINNMHSSTVNIVSLTTAKKSQLPVHIAITAKESGLHRDSICLCEQQRTVPKTALKQYVTTLSDDLMERVSDGLRIQLSL